MEGRAVALDFTLEGAGPRRRGAASSSTCAACRATAQAPVDYSKQEYRWGMAIDLSRCTGCNACVSPARRRTTSPRSGKEQVREGPRDALAPHRPLLRRAGREPRDRSPSRCLCQHCETAPCEYVCPVNATVHSDEGLNEMVYNRCVGTRYCSNNCPYKVRRFNFLDWRPEVPPTSRRCSSTRTSRCGPAASWRSAPTASSASSGARIDARAGGEKIGGDVQSGLPAGLPGRGHRLRQPERPAVAGDEAARGRAPLRPAPRARAPGRAPPTWSGSATPTRSWHDPSSARPPPSAIALAPMPLLVGPPRPTRQLTPSCSRPSSPRRRGPGRCWSGCAAAGTGFLVVGAHRHHRPRHRHLGQQQPGGLGLRHHQLRLVDRHRPRRHAHLAPSCCSSSRSGAPPSTASPRP